MGARLWIRDADGNIREESLKALYDAVARGTESSDAALEEGIVIGRDQGADITLDDPAVSRFHARLAQREGHWWLRDLGSSNRTFINGDPVSESILQAGDSVGIGDCELHLVDEVQRVESSPSQTQILGRIGRSEAVDHRASAVLSGLYRLSQEFANGAERSSLVDSALRVLVEDFDADRGAVLTIDGDALLCRAAHSRHGQALRGFVISQTIYREVMQGREAVLSRDTTTDERFHNQQSIVGEEIRTVLAAPIPVGERIAGLLYLDRLDRDNDADGGAFQTEDLYGTAVAAKFLGAALNAGNQLETLEEERQTLVRTIIDTHPIIGTSPAIQRVRDFIKRAAPTQSTVLIQGETGTGKELVARAIHYQSRQAGHPFVAINCAAIPESLVESELFGHEKGAFTGAVSRKVGKFEAANHGTVFLDEIGELPVGCQSKLLRLLEERCFERVGGTESIEIDVRILAATNRDLADEAAENRFREDLYYRLNVLQVNVAPLKDRPEDVEVLVEHFLDYFSQRVGGRRKTLSKAALAKLLSHQWPGNIRQLRNTIESGVVMSAGDEIQLHDLPIMPAARGSGQSPAWQPRSLQEVEREHIERVLDFMNWNKSKAAETLGIERSTLYARIRNFEIKPPNER